MDRAPHRCQNSTLQFNFSSGLLPSGVTWLLFDLLKGHWPRLRLVMGISGDGNRNRGTVLSWIDRFHLPTLSWLTFVWWAIACTTLIFGVWSTEKSNISHYPCIYTSIIRDIKRLGLISLIMQIACLFILIHILIWRICGHSTRSYFTGGGFYVKVSDGHWILSKMDRWRIHPCLFLFFHHSTSSCQRDGSIEAWSGAP